MSSLLQTAQTGVQLMDAAGQKHGNFVVTRVEPVEELCCQLVELEHQRSGARVIQIANDDPENLFCLSFQTIPQDSTGVAHILEHTVLCGSQQFPVKDPFFAMIRRSLHTFMNALTGSDFTCYPAATQVPKDFYNLLTVYLDAVFFPKLREISFLQEGHRFEIGDAGLEYKGVVFNEMKGAMATPTSRLYDQLYNALFPDVTYGHNSGGAPEAIPNLTYEELVAFHRHYYHPSRCLFFFYGNMDLQGHLDFIEEKVLSHAERVAPLPPVAQQPRFTAPQRLRGRYPVAASELDDAKAYITLGWLTCPIADQETVLALTILESALMDTDASPLKKALLTSGLCTQANALIDPDIAEVPVALIIKGCDCDAGEAIETVVRDTLEQLVEEGIPQSLIDNAMHQLEFQRSEIAGDRYPFGLTLFMRAVLLKQHGVDPANGLRIHSLFEQIRSHVAADSAYFTQLLRTHFLDNPHFVRLSLVPDAALEKEEAQAEKARLKAEEAALTPQQKERINSDAQALADYQLEQEKVDHEVLPKVTLADVPRVSVDYALTVGMSGDMHTFFHDTFTNQIVYADLSWRLPQIEENSLWQVRLFAALLTQMGAGGHNYSATLEAMQAHTGGIGTALNLAVSAEESGSVVPAFHLHGKALYRKGAELFSLMRDFAAAADFSDLERLKQVVMKHYTGLKTSLTQHAMSYALALASSGLSPASKLYNAWHGLDYYLKVKELAENLDVAALAEAMQQLQKQLLQLAEPHLIITCDSSYYKRLEKEGFYGLGAIDKVPFVPWSNHAPLLPITSQGRAIASPVAFTAKALATAPYIAPASAPLSIAANLFDNTTLHVAIREQGGAYGGGTSCRSLEGELLFYAYRDPNIASTLAAFSDAVTKIAAGDFDARELEEGKLEKIQSLDTPAAPGSRGVIAYSWLQEGRTLERRQQFRDRLLAATKGDVVDAIQQYLVPQIDDAPAVVFAGQELLESENGVMERKLTLAPLS